MSSKVVGTRFDYSVNGKVFFIRDSERYTAETSVHITLSSSNITYGDDLIVDVTVEGLNGQGRIQLYCDDVLVDTAYTLGDISFTLKNLDSGEHTILVKFTGNNYCLASHSTATVNVSYFLEMDVDENANWSYSTTYPDLEINVEDEELIASIDDEKMDLYVDDEGNIIWEDLLG